MDHGFAACVDFLAEVGDVELYDIGLAAKVVVPDVVEDLGLGDDPLGVFHEVAQEVELGCGELDVLACSGDFAGVDVEGEVADH